MTNVSSDLCVIITARDAATTIGDAISSALEQPQVGEVVLVDDASSDQTADIALQKSKGDTRLHVIRMSTNIGPAAARNLAIAESVSPLIAVLDADDYFLADRAAALLSCQDWDIVADNIVFVPESQMSLCTRADLPESDASALIRMTTAEFIRGNIPSRTVNRGELGFLKPIISRAFLDAHNLRYDETLRLGEDYDLYVRMLANGARFSAISQVGYVARVRPNSLSGRHNSSDLRALCDASEKHALLPLQSQDRAALADYLASLKARYLLHAFLERKRDHGLWSAAAFALNPPVNFSAIARGIARDKFSKLWGDTTETSDSKRFLLPVD